MGPLRNSTPNAPAPGAASEEFTTEDDAGLIRQIAHGRHRAFDELVHRHARYLYGIAHSLTRNAADAEDIVQETFVAVLDTTFRGQARVRTWLVSILVRQAAVLRRRRSLARAQAGPENLPDPRGSGIAGAEARMDLATMLEALSPEHREVIVLRELEGMSYEEMAIALGVPRGTIESRLHRARAELRERFRGS